MNNKRYFCSATCFIFLFLGIFGTTAYAYTPTNGYDLFASAQCDPLYGNMWGTDGDIDNEQIGGPDNLMIALKWRSAYTETLTAFRFHGVWSERSGYSGGTGGRILISLHADNGSGQPANQILTQAIVERPISTYGIRPNSQDFFIKTSFDTPYPVQKDTLYYVVLRNIDPNPQANFISIDGPFANGTNDFSQQCISSSDYGALRTANNPTATPPTFTMFPINDFGHELYFSNGHVQGYGYTHSTLTEDISGSTKVRQVFTPTQNLTSTGTSIRVGGTGGPNQGGIHATLHNLANNAAIADCTIPGTQITPGWTNCTGASCAFKKGNGIGMDFASCNWTAQVVLSAGTAYSIEYAAAGAGSYRINASLDGEIYGFESSFQDGHAQVSQGGSWTNIVKHNQKTDLSFFLRLQEDTPPCGILGDIDCSGEVNVLDLSILLSDFARSISDADLDSSGDVNLIDLSALLRNYGR